MSKSSTYLLRLDPQKKARRMLLAKEMGVSLAEWIDLACEFFESNVLSARMNAEFMALCPMKETDVPIESHGQLRDLAKEAREQHNRGETTPLEEILDEILEPPVIGAPNEFQDTNPVTWPAPGVYQPFERKPVGKIAKMLKEKG